MVGLNVFFYWYPIGGDDFLYSFFSTIAYRLEGGEWGSRFPTIIKELCDKGEVSVEHLDAGAHELAQIHEELKQFPPSDVIWEFENPDKQPPWGDEISDTITDLSNYYVTSEGAQLFDKLFLAFEDAKRLKYPVKIKVL